MSEQIKVLWLRLASWVRKEVFNLDVNNLTLWKFGLIVELDICVEEWLFASWSSALGI